MKDPSKPNGSQGREHAADPTIVGGRPPGRSRARVQIPQGIEVLLKKASVDPEFRRILMEKRAAAAAEIGLELSAAEIAMLNAVSQAQIEQIIKNTTVPNEHRRVFLGKIGAAMLAMIGFGVSGCMDDLREVIDNNFRPGNRFGGIRPDVEGVGGLRPVAVRVGPGSERLTVEIADQGHNVLTVSVGYDCPFASAGIRLIFCDRDQRIANVTGQPAVHFVSNGKGAITFSVHGTTGTTDWLIVQLKSLNGKCVGILENKAFLSNLEPGEYSLGDCAIWKVELYHNAWGA